jgi:hypothetical protein
MRSFVFVLAACGSSAKPAAPISSRAPAETAPPLATDAPTDCSSHTEDSKPGNHDRFTFETPDGLYGYKDSKGNVVITPTLRFAYEFKPGGIAAVVDANAQFAFIDASGKRIARAYAFDNGPDYFQEGFARIVDDNQRVGFISDRGIILAQLAPRFEKADSFCGGKAKVMERGTVFFVDRSGAPTDPPLGASLKFESDYVD